jgi:MarR family transcriptional regulator, organic hydroperoxide resistance regulator
MDVLKKFRLVFRSAKKHFQWVEQRCGVSGAQLLAMWELGERPGMRVSELASALSIHQSTASNMLDKLEGRSLIRRERSEHDQRVVKLFLTESGREVVAKAPQPARGVLVAALDGMPTESLCELEKQLDALIQGMKVRDRDGALTPLSDI